MLLSRGNGWHAGMKKLGRRVYSWKALSLGIAMALSVTAFLPAAMTSPISFDGAMNLQVAQNLADHGQYARHYTFRDRDNAEQIKSNVRTFPSEVQTNGPYTVVAALGIKLFGHNQFAYQFANLFFVAAIAATIWWILRRSLIVAALSPVVILLSLKFTFQLSISGYGDIPAIFFVLLAFILMAKAATARNEIRALRYVGLSLLFFGGACITKTYLVGALPALVAGLLVAYRLNKQNLPFSRLKPRFLYVLIVPVLYELGRLFSYGSFIAYFRYWRHEVRLVLQQTGIVHYTQQATTGRASHGGGVFEKFSKHTISLFHYVSHLTVLLILAAVALGLLWLAWRAYSRTPSRSKKIQALLKFETTKEYVAILSMLAIMAASYFAWWIVLLPTQKEFVRRSYPGTIPFEIALILVGVILIKIYFGKSAQLQFATKSRAWALKLISVLYLGVICLILVSTAVKSWKWTDSGSFAGLDAWRSTASFVKNMPKSYTLYGVKWQSAPIASLMSGRDFRNIDSANFCALDPSKDFVVWDVIASHNRTVGTPATYDQALEYTVYKQTPAAIIYRVSSNPAKCINHQ
jgi:hypothetical protein